MYTIGGDIVSVIGDYIRKTRQMQCISIRQLSSITGISYSEINKIENGDRNNPSPNNLKMLAIALGINQINIYKIASYIDENEHELALSKSIDLIDYTEDEIIQIEKYASFIKAQRTQSQGDQIMKTTKLKVASLFAGIGGICYGFNQAGAKVIWANEMDKDACKTYRHNFGSSYLIEADIKNIDPTAIPDIDILNGGFPCQAFSIAGYRRGFEDERGNLFFEIERILKVKKPRAILLENVKNLEGHDHGNTFKVIKYHLEKLGYHIQYKVLNTMEYGNIPQHRKRIYIVGFLSEEAYNKFIYPEPIQLTKTIHDIINVRERKPLYLYYNNSKYYPELIKTMVNKNTVYQWRRVYCRENKSNVCPTLTANMGTGGHNVPLIIDDFGIRKLTPEECVGFQGFPNQFKFPDDISNASKYKQAGNSVSVPVVKRIIENMIKALET